MNRCQTCHYQTTKLTFNRKSMKINGNKFCKYYTAFIENDINNCPAWKQKAGGK